MTPVLDRSTPQVPSPVSDDNGEHAEADPRGSGPTGDDDFDKPEKEAVSRISIADALARNAAQREQLISAGRESIKNIEAARAESNADADKRIADIRAQIGEPAKTRKKREAKTEPVVIDENLARMVFEKPYTSNQAKALFDGRKPGQVLAAAIEAKLIKKMGVGAGSVYTRVK